ncbi:DeoR/GlpR family DNA-binding transcription regulator [Paenisporosarcina sp. TG20]|uniref:DeoR/GlpR family DNA-binding transcription regulator n=1 Tax=Paenisporosarcina sp. TG20 TaxID=1211706 RepID=UPI0002FDB3A1|nr:DeoR/GlpR family DNA-binding transcription regulator [Paenisporosarcina sp. TG20]
MLTNERYGIILGLLAKKQTIKIQDIVDATGSSESTIRRDLTELENQNRLERVFGGAMLTDRNSLEPSILDKSTKNLQEKKRLAKFAASFIKEGDCIFLDAGSTTFQMIPHMKDKDIVVVTNGLTHVDSLNEYGITTYLTGGLIKSRTAALVGSQTIQSLQSYRFDKCFLGVNGFHEQYGYTTPDPEEASIKRLASSLSRKTYVVTDHTKYEKVSFSKIIDLEYAVLIVDNLSLQTIESLRNKTTVKVEKT